MLDALASTPSASRTNRSTARSSSRPRRLAASSRRAIVVSNCCAAARRSFVARGRRCGSCRVPVLDVGKLIPTRCVASACSRSICSQLAPRSRAGRRAPQRLRRSIPCCSRSGGRRHLLGGAPDLRAAVLRTRCSSTVARLGVGVDPRLDLARELHPPLREPGDLGGEALLELVQVAAQSVSRFDAAARRRATRRASPTRSARSATSVRRLGDPPPRRRAG